MRVLFVSSAGGHLAELYRLKRRLVENDDDVRWISTDHPHSRTLLAGEQALFVPDAPSRDLRAVLKNLRLTSAEVRRFRPERTISNGASLALSVLPVARALGSHSVYIENSVRVSEPSTTGKLMQLVPGLDLRCQYPGWPAPWQQVGTVLDEWRSDRAPHSQPIRSIVVTVGTTEWGFRRLFERLQRIVSKEVNILWQVGSSDVTGLGIKGIHSLSSSTLKAAVTKADVVIAHAGIGSAVLAFESGKLPVLVPRRKEFKEAVNNHQVDIGRELASRGLCVFTECDSLTIEHLEQARKGRIREVPNPAPLKL